MDTKHKILVIEDEADLRDSLKEILLAHGYEVIVTETSEHGLQLVPTVKPDLILLDIFTGSMHASLFLQRLRDLSDETKNTKVLVLTNLDQEQTKEKLEKFGIVGYMVKLHVSLQEVVAKVKDLLTETPDYPNIQNNILQL